MAARQTRRRRGTLPKTSAYALQGRGLATVDRRGGQWRAKITDAGRHYLEHGTYPSGGTLSRPPAKPVSAPRRPASVIAPDSVSRCPRVTCFELTRGSEWLVSNSG